MRSQTCALALSLAAHASLGLAVHAGKNEHSDAPTATSATSIQVNLLPAGEANTAPQTAPTHAADSVFIEHSMNHLFAMSTSPPAPLPIFLLAAQSRYFNLNELSEKPVLVHDVTPDLSYLDLPAGPAQTAMAQLFINEIGEIDRIEIEQSQLPTVVEHVVIEAYAKLKFHPGEIDGIAVKSQLKIQITLDK